MRISTRLGGICVALGACGAPPAAPTTTPAERVATAKPEPNAALEPSLPAPAPAPSERPPAARAPSSFRVKLLELKTPPDRLPVEVVERIVRQKRQDIRACYARALQRDPNLSGRIGVSFVIEADGTVSHVTTTGAEVPDVELVRCVTSVYSELDFPQPEDPPFAVVAVLEFLPPLPAGN